MPVAAHDPPMGREFSREDEGKRVVDSEGNEVGMLSLIEGDEDDDHGAEVDRSEADSESRITDGLMEMLGWERDADRGRLRGEHVDRADEDRIYLRGEERDPENDA